MTALRVLSMVAGIVIATTVAGCGGGEASRSESGPTQRRTFHGETRLYRVEVTQYERDGRCLRRTVLFRSHSKLYIQSHLDRVQATDEGCDATYISSFEHVAVMRSPLQQDQYARNFAFRNRINEDLWIAYQQALFDDERARRRGKEDA